MDKTSILGIKPQQKVVLPYQLPDDESYMAVLELRDRVESKGERFQLSKIDYFLNNATLAYAGKVVVFFCWDDGLLRFYYCEKKEIVEIRYVERLSKGTKLVPSDLRAGVEWDIERIPEGLGAYARTPVTEEIETSKQTTRFCNRFTAVTPKVKSKKGEASEDEDGVFSLNLHLIPDGGPK